LYILAWKSFTINQILYIQNRKPFVISESLEYTKGEGLHHLEPLERINQPGPEEAAAKRVAVAKR
jgi:hypothetical protein